MNEEQKDELIKKLTLDVAEKEAKLMENVMEMSKVLVFYITDKEAREKAILLIKAMKDHIKIDDEQRKSLDLCETMDEIEAWRIRTGL
jgi:hypothetical protein